LKLLLDENLSPRLIGKLQIRYPDSQHAELLGLKGQSDLHLWEYAASTRPW
jgi:predicted nuclease of predicted toxin-antitoxin system